MKTNPYLAGDGKVLVLPLLLVRVASEFSGEVAGTVLMSLATCAWVFIIWYWWRRENRLRQVEDPDVMVLHAIKWLRIYQLLGAGVATSLAVDIINGLLKS